MESQSLSQAVPVVTGDRIQGSPESLEKRRSGGGPHEPFTRPGKVPGHLFPTVGRSIEDVRIEDIQSINRIPDPINPTSAERPYLAKTEKGYFCIDGSDKIATAAAKSGSSSVVSCAVDTLAEHDDDDLVVRKATIRSATRGGKAEHMELCRNAVFLLNWHTSSNPNLKVNTHGGRRRGPEFTSNALDNAYKVLSDLLCKSETTIAGYVDHIKYLTAEAVRFFIVNRVKKEYFDDMRVEKRQLVAKLIEEGQSDEQIAAAVSSKMITRYASFSSDKKKKKDAQAAEKKQPTERTKRSGRSAKENGQDVPDPKSVSPAPEDHRTGSTNGNNTARGPEPDPGTQAQTINNNDLEDGVIRDEDLDSPFTVEDIKNAARGISMRLHAHMEADLGPEQLKSCFEREMANLSDLLRKTESLLMAS